MALSGAVTGRPRFSYLRSSNISKKRDIDRRFLFDIYPSKIKISLQSLLSFIMFYIDTNTYVVLDHANGRYLSGII